MYIYFFHLSCYLLEVIVHFRRANPGDVLLTFVNPPNYFYQCCLHVVRSLNSQSNVMALHLTAKLQT